ncbi:MAG: hypothetical protein WC378_13370 [Opitutaceae bacterium]|jgi:hypothetical protein
MATKNHAEALRALDKIEKILTGPKALVAEDLCKTYAKIKPLLETALTLIGLIPIYGAKIVVAIKFLMTLADKMCAV